MASIIEYVEQELHTLNEKPFTEVDSLVLSQLSYLRMGSLVPGLGRPGGIPLAGLLKAEYFDRIFHNVRAPGQNKRLLVAACASPRFRNLVLCNYVEERDTIEEKQFSAVTFLMGDGRRYLAFRGTDADLVGWKEDFNMAFKTPVPAQKAALEYVAHAARVSRDILLLGGHSKGGNLAAYSAVYSPAPLQGRIAAVYSHDGPGFKMPLDQNQGFLRIKSRLYKTMPQSALVGMLLEHQENYSVVKSDRLGPMQHDPFSWQVQDGAFVKLEEISAGARYMDATLNQWLSGLSDSEREQFVDALFGVLEAGGISNFAEERNCQEELPAMVESVKNIDADTRKMLFKTFGALAMLAVRNLPQSYAPAEKDERQYLHSADKKGII